MQYFQSRQSIVRISHLILMLLVGLNSLSVMAFTSLPQKKTSKQNLPTTNQGLQANVKNVGVDGNVNDKAQDPTLFAHQSIRDLQQQMNLSESQKEKIRPVLEEGSRLRAKVLEKHQVDFEDISGLSLRRKIALGRDLKEVRKGTLKALETVLSDPQLETYKKISRAYLEKIKAKIKTQSATN